MTTLTLPAAYQELANNFAFYANPANRQALLELAGQVDATNSTGAVTLAYSGYMNSGLHSSDVINTLKANKENVRLIDYTDAGKFLDSDEFRDAVAQSFDLEDSRALSEAPSDHPANKWRYNATEGPWALASEKFIGSATGEIWSFSNGADPTRVFGATELPAALKNPDITHINGIAKTDLLKLTPEQQFNAVAAQAEVKAAELQYTANPDGTAIKNADGTLKGLDASKFFEGTDVKLNMVSSDPDLKPLASYYTPQQLQQHAEGQKVLQNIKQSYIDQVNLIGPEHQVTRVTALKALDKLGIAGDLLLLVFVATQANDAYAAGDTQAGNKIIQDWSIDFAGGLAGGVLAAKLAGAALAPLYLTGPAGALLASGLTLLAGLAGGILGGLGLTSLIENWTTAKNTTSPLIVDLDGDGVETLAKSTGIHFDHAGDGFAESTGWAGADDGLLVRDLNGDGSINNGGELFGNNTRLSNGQNAANGFEALKDLDSNKDGKLNSADTAWNTLRVWKDTDGDAQTDTGELLTLAEAGVKEFKLAYANSTTTDQNGNEHKQTGSYTTTAGTVRAVHDVWFVTDNWNTIDQRTPVELSSEVAALPEVMGSGNLGSLRQAMMRDTSGNLTAAVSAYSQSGNASAEERDVLLQDILYRWAGVFEQDPSIRSPYLEDGRKLAVLEAFFGEQYVQLGANTTGPNIPGPDASIALIRLFGDVAANLGAQLDAQGRDIPFYNAIGLTWNESTQAFSIDASGVETLIREIHAQQPQQALDDLRQFIFNLQALGTTEVLKALSVSGNLQGDEIDQLLARATWHWGTSDDDWIEGEATQSNLLFGGTGDDYLYGGNGNDTLDGGAGNDVLDGGTGADVYFFGKGSGQDTINNYDYDTVGTNADTILLGAGIATTGVTLTRSWNDLIIHINGTNDSLRVQSYFLSEGASSYVVENLKFADGTVWNVATIKTKVLESTAGDDYMDGHATADTINGGDGNDTIDGQAGNDTIYGGTGEDRLNGEEGNDTLDGGTGNDSLRGGTGADTYLFGRGSGQDTIYNYNYGAVGTEADMIVLGAGISPTDVTLKRSDYDLIIGLNGTNDSLRVQSYFSNDGTTGAAVGQIKFADGSIWDVNTVKAKVITGTDENDTLKGYATADTLNGGAGADTMAGDLGDDVLDGGTGNDYLGGGYGNDTIYGGTGEDRLNGEEGNDTLDGGTGNDSLRGGTGADTYLFGRGSGQDTIYNYNYGAVGTEADMIVLGAGISPTDVTLKRSDYDLIIGVNGTSDTLLVKYYFGNDGIAAQAVQQIKFADGTSWYANTIKARVLMGTGENDTLTGYATNDLLNGGTGADRMAGGLGNDTYVVDNTSDVVSEATNAGTDLVQSSVNYKLGANLENLTLSGKANLRGTGNTLNNTLTGNTGNNVLNGGTGADTMAGGLGNDTYVVDNTRDVVSEAANAGRDLVRSSVSYTLGANLENLALTGKANLSGTGNALNNVLTGNAGANTLTGGAGNDTLNGGTGADKLLGGTGNDTYVVDNTADVVAEAANAGTDLVQSSVNHTLGANLENLALTGTAAINGTGNALNNVLTGNNAANVLNGGTGADRMAGGLGNDTYVVDNTADVVAEAANAGTDLVQSSVNHTLGANLENLALTGTAAINGTGNALNNILIGNTANNVLNGGTGADRMAGGLGNDTYVVDNTADVVAEAANAGTDLVQSSVNHTLGANLENLTLTGTAAINGAGNALNNVLTGNAGANTLTGGAGNDTYVVGTGDTTIELAGGGTDTVISNINWTLGANLENLTLTGTAAINGAGNALNNVLTGNNAANVLNGGTGADRMAGGLGNDTYVVDNTRDVVAEAANAGRDLVRSSVNHTLGANLENLALTGTAAINGTGNALNNVLTGNAGANTLTGGAGNDNLNGGAGEDQLYGEDGNDLIRGGTQNDTLYGGNGHDTFTFSKGDGRDTIYVSQGSGTNFTETLILNNMNSTEVNLIQYDGSLYVQQKGSSSDHVKIVGHFGGGVSALDKLIFADGLTWNAATINANSVEAVQDPEHV
jgi:Ca2+-binding RTX toxin-like protein